MQYTVNFYVTTSVDQRSSMNEQAELLIEAASYDEAVAKAFEQVKACKSFRELMDKASSVGV